VDRVVVDLMPTDALVGHFGTLDRMVATRYGDFVTTFKLLTESATTDRFRVLVQATVSTAGLRRQIAAAGIALDKTPMPKLLLCVSETVDGMAGARYWWQPGRDGAPVWIDTVLRGPLSAKGYAVVDPTPSSALPDAPDLDLAAARTAAGRYGADIVILGSSTARMSENTMGQELKTYKGTVVLRAYRVSNGELLAQAQHEVFASGESDDSGTRAALADAGRAAGDELAVKMAAAWLSAGGSISRIVVSAEGSAEIIDYVMFRRALKKMQGVKAIQTRVMRPGLARFIVDFQGRERDLAQGVVLNEFDRFKLDIYEIEPGSVKVQLIAR